MRLVARLVACATILMALGGCAVVAPPPPLPATTAPPTALPTHSPAQPRESPSTGALQVADGFSAPEHAAVRIRARTCDAFTVGSGFVLDAHTVVTNRHVVEDAPTITLSTYDGQVFEASGSVIADFADLALVKVDATLQFPATIAAEGPTAGDVLEIVGYPLGGPLDTRTGPYLERVADRLVQGRNDVDLIQVASEHGSSGSGVYNADGAVVGVLYATDEASESFAVTLKSLKTFLGNEALQLPNDHTCD